MKPIRTLLILLALCFAAGLARAQTTIQMGVITVAASNNNGAGIVQAILPAVPGKVTFVCGISVTGNGATGASVVEVTLGAVTPSNVTLRYELAIPAGVSLAVTPLIVPFTPCLPAPSANTTITLQVPSFGAGNGIENATAWGYQQ